MIKCNTFFRVILTGKFISNTFCIIQDQRLILRSSNRMYNFLPNRPKAREFQYLLLRDHD